MKKSILTLIFFSTILVGCSNKNYQNINNMKKAYNTRNGDAHIILSHKNFNPTKKIFLELNNNLTNDFIYIYSWVNHLPISGTNHFKSLIYDRKSSKQIYISNTLKDVNSINLRDDKTNYKEEQLILDYYIGNRMDAIISLSPPFSSSEIGSEYFLFDSVSKNTYVIKNLVLNNNGEVFK
ncbi:hypothetical protein [Flavobacterium sp. T12S277]|uniref:hypothetical protein n=1 Tax=Flavobacterium sp. T12S277 TaxID=3402752 RepID=UPI003AE8C67F